MDGVLLRRVHRQMSVADARQLVIPLDGTLTNRFRLRFVPAGNLALNVTTAHGRVTAAATVPIQQIERGGLWIVRVGTFVGRRSDGIIPIVADTRLLGNAVQLIRAVRHEVAEVNYILTLRRRYFTREALDEELRHAHEAFGVRAETMGVQRALENL